MDAIEKREQLDKAHRNLRAIVARWDGDPFAAIVYDSNREKRIIRECLELVDQLVTLTPPEGFVLVDAKLLGSVRVARLAILQKQAEAEQMDDPHDASMWADCAADLDAIAPRGMLAARPEVK